MGALLSFLGGSVFRMFFGEIAAWLNKMTDHKFEIERLRLQAEVDAAQHGRNMEALRVQAELGVKMIQVQGEADAARIEIEGWAGAVKQSATPTGIYLVDLWNGVIRPLAASIAIMLWVIALNAQGWKMGDWDRELTGAILGFFFASRMMQKMGK